MVSMSELLALDPDRCYRAAQSRDARFDGWFYIAVRTTGIYCRPSCPAITPKRSNVEFHRSAAAAQLLGFRACKRCRPDAAPGSPEWDARGDVVARAMRLIGDGLVDREGVEGLSTRLGYSTRHLNRLLNAELGAGPLALARAQRAQTARVLIETTDMTMTDIAYAAGFGSVRQFNDTVREVYAMAPSDLRVRRGASGAMSDAGSVSVRLAVRQPYDTASMFRFLAARAVPGVELASEDRYERVLSLPRGFGSVAVTAGDGALFATFRLHDWRDLAPAVGRIRRLFDLDADPVAIDQALSADAALAPLVDARPGLRAAGSVDPYETLVRAIIGQQVSVAGARTVTGKLAAAISEPAAFGSLTRTFPSMARIAEAEPSVFAMPTARAATIQRVAAHCVAGDLDLDAGTDREEIVERLCAIKGIGPWTARYVVMRGLGDPDVFLDTDLVVKHAMTALDIDLAATARWRPWRTYAMHHLWAAL